MTVLLAYLNAKYKHDYMGVFFATFFIDCLILFSIIEAIRG